METFTTEVTEVIDYTWLLSNIEKNSALIADASVWIVGFLLFFVVVLVLYFCYKFIRIFI